MLAGLGLACKASAEVVNPFRDGQFRRRDRDVTHNTHPAPDDAATIHFEVQALVADVNRQGLDLAPSPEQTSRTPDHGLVRKRVFKFAGEDRQKGRRIARVSAEGGGEKVE